MEDFQLITDQDKNQISYGACVSGMTLTGMAVGRFLSLQGLLAGGVVGAIYGLLSCKRLQPVIKNKLFSANEKLSDNEILSALKIIKEQNPKVSKNEAFEVLANIRAELNKNPGKYKSV